MLQSLKKSVSLFFSPTRSRDWYAHHIRKERRMRDRARSRGKTQWAEHHKFTANCIFIAYYLDS